MVDIKFSAAELTASEQALLTAGFREHSEEQGAPEYERESVKWLAVDEQDDIIAILAADLLWDWLYIDELWVSPGARGTGLGKKLVSLAEELAISRGLRGIWLWTQSWQGVDFYSGLGYEQFARFDEFPRGHARIGFRKELS